jgi:hypothetical protein
MATATGLDVIKRTILAVAKGENNVVQAQLQILPLQEIDEDTAESLITWLLEQAYKVKNVEGARMVISIFNVKRASVDQLPALTKLLLNTSLSRDALTFAFQAFPEYAPTTHFNNLFNSQNDVNALKAAALLTVLFSDMTSEEWVYLRDLIKDYEDVEDESYEFHLPLLKAFIDTKVAETNKAVSKPDWVIECTIGQIALVPKEFPPVKMAVSLIINDMKVKNLIGDDAVDNDNFLNNLIAQYAISTMKEKHALLSVILPGLPLYDDTSVFRELGPVNSVYSHAEETVSHYKCQKYGGCRMLTCTEYETISVVGDDIDIFDQHQFATDWFRGSCDKCLQQIAKRHYAIRKPLMHGGWTGCYCSFECLGSMSMNTHEAMMIGRVKEQLTVMGIRERK